MDSRRGAVVRPASWDVLAIDADAYQGFPNRNGHNSDYSRGCKEADHKRLEAVGRMAHEAQIRRTARRLG